MRQINLNVEKTSCFVTEAGTTFALTVGMTVDYQSADTNEKSSMGKILEFKYAGFDQCDKASIWMNVKDAQEDKQTEWISVNNWVDKNMPKANASPEPQVPTDLPF